MTDPTIPADLIAKLAHLLHEFECGCGLGPDAAHHDAVSRLLSALSEHYAGSLIDPATWERVTMEPVGVDWCGYHGYTVAPGYRPVPACSVTPLYTMIPQDPTEEP